MYNINTDEEFFNSFKHKMLQFQQLLAPFQNSGQTMDEQEYQEWFNNQLRLYSDIGLLLMEAKNRIVKDDK